MVRSDALHENLCRDRRTAAEAGRILNQATCGRHDDRCVSRRVGICNTLQGYRVRDGNLFRVQAGANIDSRVVRGLVYRGLDGCELDEAREAGADFNRSRGGCGGNNENDGQKHKSKGHQRGTKPCRIHSFSLGGKLELILGTWNRCGTNVRRQASKDNDEAVRESPSQKSLQLGAFGIKMSIGETLNWSLFITY